MPLQAAFALSATNPPSNGPNPGGPDAPHVDAYLSAYGIYAAEIGGHSLPDQVANDEIIIGFDPVDPADENDITHWSQMSQRNTIQCHIVGHNLHDDHQYLLICGFKKRIAPVIVQFFVGSEWVLSEPIDDDTETVALLLDAPVSSWLFVKARLASQNPVARVGFTGIEGFIL